MHDDDQRVTDPGHIFHPRFGSALNIEHSSLWGLQSVDWECDLLISVRIFLSQTMSHTIYILTAPLFCLDFQAGQGLCFAINWLLPSELYFISFWVWQCVLYISVWVAHLTAIFWGLFYFIIYTLLVLVVIIYNLYRIKLIPNATICGRHLVRLVIID